MSAMTTETTFQRAEQLSPSQLHFILYLNRKQNYNKVPYTVRWQWQHINNAMFTLNFGIPNSTSVVWFESSCEHFYIMKIWRFTFENTMQVQPVFVVINNINCIYLLYYLEMSCRWCWLYLLYNYYFSVCIIIVSIRFY